MTKNLYEVLDLQKDADKDAIRKSYMRLSKTHHPDRGGDPEKFKEVNEAYEILFDDNRRQQYDLTGSTDGQMANQFEGGMPDIFQMFGGMFGGGGPPGFGGPPRQQKRQKPSPKTTDMPLTLYDYYYGKQVKLTFERKKFCDGCKGEGALSYRTCNDCQGNGYREQLMQMGPGFAAINRQACGPCSSKGKIPAKMCDKCHGKKFMTQEKTLHAKIEPGMRPGETLVFANECSDDPQYVEPGDVNIILQEADEPTTDWKRVGDDLHTDLKIGLIDMLVGGEKKLITHPGYPGGISVTIEPGTQNGDTITLLQKGMPKRNANGFGNLFVRITVLIHDVDKLKLRSAREELLRMLS